MNKILILCNTYYQLITAIQMKLTLFKDESVSLALSDHSRNAEKIFEAIKRESLFDDCALINTKDEISTKSVLSIARSINQGIFGVQTDTILKRSYDEFIFNNLECITYSIFNTLLKYNPQIKCNRLEEGVLSYDFIDKRIKKVIVVEKIRKPFSKPIITVCTQKLYCFYPNVYKGNLQTVRIPRIKIGDEATKVIRNIFNLDLSTAYSEKYIYFTSVYDFEGGTPIGEFEIVKRVGEMVGKDNLLIKMHPRDTRGLYEKEGFKVDKNSSVPWEAIQLSSDFSDKVFLSTTSGSVLAGSLLSEKPVKTIYMYNFCYADNNNLAKGSITSINNLLKDEFLSPILTGVSVATKYEDILSP